MHAFLKKQSFTQVFSFFPPFLLEYFVQKNCIQCKLFTFTYLSSLLKLFLLSFSRETPVFSDNFYSSVHLCTKTNKHIHVSFFKLNFKFMYVLKYRALDQKLLIVRSIPIFLLLTWQESYYLISFINHR